MKTGRSTVESEAASLPLPVLLFSFSFSFVRRGFPIGHTVNGVPSATFGADADISMALYRVNRVSQSVGRTLQSVRLSRQTDFYDVTEFNKHGCSKLKRIFYQAHLTFQVMRFTATLCCYDSRVALLVVVLVDDEGFKGQTLEGELENEEQKKKGMVYWGKGHHKLYVIYLHIQ